MPAPGQPSNRSKDQRSPMNALFSYNARLRTQDKQQARPTKSVGYRAVSTRQHNRALNNAPTPVCTNTSGRHSDRRPGKGSSSNTLLDRRRVQCAHHGPSTDPYCTLPLFNCKTRRAHPPNASNFVARMHRYGARTVSESAHKATEQGHCVAWAET